ncbi:MAG: TonB family protein, partial [Acidobacteriota bacterium]
MPLNVRRLYTSVLLVLVGFVLVSVSQTVLPAPSPTPQTSTDPQTVQPPVRVPTAGEIMRDRISKAKAFIAVRNYNAAIYELENIRRETADASVQAVVNVLLMNSYLEQADYKKAQDFLNDFYNKQKTTKPNATANYLAIASQVVKSARNRVERYRALGLNVGDRTLPLEAVNDLEKMRETLELVITQSKEVGKDKAKTPDAMALLEEAANSRSLMARDEYDARRWKDVVGDTREQVAVSRSVVVNAVNDGVPDAAVQQNTAPTQNQIAANNQTAAVPTGSMPTEPKPMFLPVMPDNKTTKPADNLNASVQKPIIVQNPKTDDRTAASNNPANAEPKALVISNPQTKPNDTNTAAPAAKEQGPMDVGSLLAYATRQAPPLYPPAAKSIRATGIVRVEVTVDENGDVAAVQKTSGPPLLQGAAKDAIKKWRFKPFVRDGQPVKATGFVNFNF